MNLGQLIAREARVQPDQVLLLRHSNAKVEKLIRAGASIEEYTLVQPTNSKYDFFADGKPRIQVVVAIANDVVFAVYRLTGVERVGTTRTLTSPAFRAFDIVLGYPEVAATRFAKEELNSRSIRCAVMGWTSPRNAVARYGNKLFESVEVLLR